MPVPLSLYISPDDVIHIKSYDYLSSLVVMFNSNMPFCAQSIIQSSSTLDSFAFLLIQSRSISCPLSD